VLPLQGELNDKRTWCARRSCSTTASWCRLSLSKHELKSP